MSQISLSKLTPITDVFLCSLHCWYTNYARVLNAVIRMSINCSRNKQKVLEKSINYRKCLFYDSFYFLLFRIVDIFCLHLETSRSLSPCSGPYWLWRKKTNKNQCKNFVWEFFFNWLYSMKTCEKIKWQKAYMIFVMYFQGFQ